MTETLNARRHRATCTGGTDAVETHWAGAGRSDELHKLHVCSFAALVDPLTVTDQLGGDPSPGLARGVTWWNLRQHRLGLCRWDQLQQQLVQVADHTGVVLTQGPAPVDQDPNGELLVIDHWSQPGPCQRSAAASAAPPSGCRPSATE
jgi:hypothetical protein